MKGLVFREFLEMVEQEYGYEMVDAVIEESHIPSKGAYTSVGTYPHTEMFQLLEQLAIKTKLPESRLLKTFGEYVFGIFAKKYPVFFEHKTNSFQLLSEVENKIHVEVLKLYPEAELPNFECEIVNENEMVMLYKSGRKMSDFAEGLINGCFKYFKEEAKIEKTVIKRDGSEVQFKIIKSYE